MKVERTMRVAHTVAAGLAKNEAGIPAEVMAEWPEAERPAYVRVSAAGTTAFLKVKTVPDGDRLWLAEDTLSTLADGAEVTVSKASEPRYRWHHLLHDTEQRLLLYSLIFASAAVIIDGVLAIHAITPVGRLGSGNAVIVLMVVSLVAKVVGGGLAFYKGILSGRD